MEFSDLDSENKYNTIFKCSFPILFNKIATIDDMNYLNLIDRTFYSIRIREEFYNNYKEILGEEIDPDLADRNPPTRMIKTLFPFIGMPGLSKADFSFEDYILQVDNILLERINQNNRRIKIFYNIDHDLINKSPYPTFLNNPSLLAISPFLFELKEWFELIISDVKKDFGDPIKRGEKKYENTEFFFAIKDKLKFLPEEIQNRIGTNAIKNYMTYGLFKKITIRIDTDILALLIADLKVKDIIGQNNLLSKFQQININDNINKLQNSLELKGEKSKLVSVFDIWLEAKTQVEKKTIKEFIDFFHKPSKNIVIPDLSLYGKKQEEIFALFNLLRNKNLCFQNKKLPYLSRELKIDQNYSDSTILKKYNLAKESFSKRKFEKIVYHLPELKKTYKA